MVLDPASAADWIQASLVTGLLGGLGAACWRALRQELRESLKERLAAVPAAHPAFQDISTTARRFRDDRTLQDLAG